MFLVEFQAVYFALPFEGEEQDVGRPINAIQQRIVALGFDDSSGDSSVADE
jgi:hypothetical protein